MGGWGGGGVGRAIGGQRGEERAEPAGPPKQAHEPSARQVPLLEHGAADPPGHSRLQSAPRKPLKHAHAAAAPVESGTQSPWRLQGRSAVPGHSLVQLVPWRRALGVIIVKHARRSRVGSEGRAAISLKSGKKSYVLD